MSGFSEDSACPNCGEECDVYTDWKPISYSSYQCSHCGLMIGPQVSYMNLKELNEYRQGWGLPKLRKKPKQDKNIW
jgi:hypothetical protein